MVGLLSGLLDESKRHDCSSVAEILVVSDEPSCSYATFESGFLQQTLHPVQVKLAKLGAPHDSILVDDLARVDLKRYKLVLFLNCFHLTSAQRELIRRQVLKRNRTVISTYAPGLFDGAVTSVEAMRELTGLRLVRAERPDRVRARIELTADGTRLWSQTQPTRPLGTKTAEAGAAAAAARPNVIGQEHVWGELFSVEDGEATILGRLEGRNEAALTLKRLKHWTSVYALNPVLPAAFLSALAYLAGVHIYHDRDDTFYASRSYVCLNADGEGERTIVFPRPVDVFDPFTGELLHRAATSFKWTFKDKETILRRIAHASRQR